MEPKEPKEPKKPHHEVAVGPADDPKPSRFDASPILEPGHTLTSVTEKISMITLTRRTPIGWWIGFGIS